MHHHYYWTFVFVGLGSLADCNTMYIDYCHSCGACFRGWALQSEYDTNGDGGALSRSRKLGRHFWQRITRGFPIYSYTFNHARWLMIVLRIYAVVKATVHTLLNSDFSHLQAKATVQTFFTLSVLSLYLFSFYSLYLSHSLSLFLSFSFSWRFVLTGMHVAHQW